MKRLNLQTATDWSSVQSDQDKFHLNMTVDHGFANLAPEIPVLSHVCDAVQQ